MNSLIKYNLCGNNSVWQVLLNDALNDRIAHAYLFTGTRGCGKALTAKLYIKHLIQANEILAKRIDNNDFSDLLYIAKEDKNEITIDIIRKAHDFFNQTPAEGKYKFVIIDGAEDLNTNAANALLKILEEPKHNTHLFLISHASHQIIPTIRSRCRIIRFAPLTVAELSQITDMDKYKELEDFIAGSPGRVKLCEELNALKIYQQLLDLMESNDILAFNKFADVLAKNHSLWQLVKDLLIFIILRAHKTEISDNMQKIFKETEIYNLDRKQVLLEVLSSIR